MRNEFSIVILRRISFAALIAIAALCTLVGAFLYLSYADLLIGQIKLDSVPTILQPLASDRFGRVIKRFEKRQAMPYPPDSLNNPFNQKP